MKTIQTNTTALTKEYVEVNASAGAGVLKFIEVGISDMIGVLIDDVCMEELQTISCGLTFNLTSNQN